MRKMIYARLRFGSKDLCAARWFFFLFMRAGRPDDARSVIGGHDNIEKPIKTLGKPIFLFKNKLKPKENQYFY